MIPHARPTAQVRNVGLAGEGWGSKQAYLLRLIDDCGDVGFNTNN
jgi:hypothetical protein